MTDHQNDTGRHRPLSELQAQLETLEKKLEPKVNELLANGRGMYDALRREWRGTALNSDLKKLTSDGRKRLTGLLDRAEAAGSEALESVLKLQHTAVGALGLASRDQVEDLARAVKRLTKKAARLRGSRPAAAGAGAQDEHR
ncbi:MAG TPA: hypothetical protein VF400_16265 [Anaeromyxobacteraceae bacterium]